MDSFLLETQVQLASFFRIKGESHQCHCPSLILASQQGIQQIIQK